MGFEKERGHKEYAFEITRAQSFSRTHVQEKSCP
jgi:hypothetical protein